MPAVVLKKTPVKKTITLTVLDKVITLSNKPLPATVGNPYEAAKTIRRSARQLYDVPNERVVAALTRLETELQKPRGARKDRLAAFESVVKEFAQYSVMNRDNVRTIRANAQILPTAPGLPQTNAENILRAIVAILRSNQVIK